MVQCRPVDELLRYLLLGLVALLAGVVLAPYLLLALGGLLAGPYLGVALILRLLQMWLYGTPSEPDDWR